MTTYQVNRLKELWNKKKTVDIAAELGVPKNSIYEMAKKLSLPRNGVGYAFPIDPTPEQITERCLEVQASWTEEERERRMVGVSRQPPKWYAPAYRTRKTLRGITIEVSDDRL